MGTVYETLTDFPFWYSGFQTGIKLITRKASLSNNL